MYTLRCLCDVSTAGRYEIFLLIWLLFQRVTAHLSQISVSPNLCLVQERTNSYTCKLTA